MGSAEGGAAPKDGEGDGKSTAAAGAAAEAKPADTPRRKPPPLYRR